MTTDRTDLQAAKAALRRHLVGKAFGRHFETKVPRNLRCHHHRDGLNIVGLGLGEKTTSGRSTNTPSVVVYVECKCPKHEIPKSWQLPKDIDGFAIDVKEVGVVRAHSDCLANPRARQTRPTAMGVSIGGGTRFAGTAGCMVVRQGEHGPFMLSNFHVLGQPSGPPAGQEIYQPGHSDLPINEENRIGALFDAVPIQFDNTPNACDAAIARVLPDTARSFLCAFGELKGTATPDMDLVVRKFGKTTGYTKGIVVDDDCEVVVRYRGGLRARFVHQVRIKPLEPGFKYFSQNGDSGSIVVVGDKRVCALVMAGSTKRKSSWATPIQTVFDRLKIQLPPPPD